ncbi:unnamed protein product [Soboliphyme baturini]|uniref:Transposase n=1 Tax=Soboliphyme baturini TaxID=241478 RepID=A0A183IXC9_9BILA|nr:unnamed protein product [Soboliphyme baturini]
MDSQLQLTELPTCFWRPLAIALKSIFSNRFPVKLGHDDCKAKNRISRLSNGSEIRKCYRCRWKRGIRLKKRLNEAIVVVTFTDLSNIVRFLNAGETHHRLDAPLTVGE